MIPSQKASVDLFVFMPFAPFVRVKYTNNRKIGMICNRRETIAGSSIAALRRFNSVVKLSLSTEYKYTLRLKVLVPFFVVHQLMRTFYLFYVNTNSNNILFEMFVVVRSVKYK